MITKSCEKVAKNFDCSNCHYSTSRKSSFNKHILTDKHKRMMEGIYEVPYHEITKEMIQKRRRNK